MFYHCDCKLLFCKPRRVQFALCVPTAYIDRELYSNNGAIQQKHKLGTVFILQLKEKQKNMWWREQAYLWQKAQEFHSFQLYISLSQNIKKEVISMSQFEEKIQTSFILSPAPILTEFNLKMSDDSVAIPSHSTAIDWKNCETTCFFSHNHDYLTSFF